MWVVKCISEIRRHWFETTPQLVMHSVHSSSYIYFNSYNIPKPNITTVSWAQIWRYCTPDIEVNKFDFRKSSFQQNGVTFVHFTLGVGVAQVVRYLVHNSNTYPFVEFVGKAGRYMYGWKPVPPVNVCNMARRQQAPWTRLKCGLWYHDIQQGWINWYKVTRDW